MLSCLLVLLSCRFVMSSCPLGLSSCRLFCPVILSTCYVMVSHYGTGPIDLRCLQKRKSHDYLRTHKGCRRMLVRRFKTEVLAYCFHDTNNIIFFNLSKSMDQSFHTTLCFIRKCNCST